MEKAHILYDLLDYYETHQSKASTVGYINAKYNLTLTVRTVTGLLNDTLLYGEYKGVPDYVEPYISIERFNKIQEIVKRNVRQAYAPTHIFLFSSMIKCYDCGCTLIGNTNKSHGKIYHTMRCNKYRYHRGCTNSNSITENKIERQLLDNLDLYVANSMVRVNNIQDNVPENNNEIKIREIKDEMDRLNIMFRKRRISEEEYDTDYYKLEKKLEELTVDHVEPREIDIDHLKELLESNWREIYNNLDKERKRAFWHGIIKEFTIGEDRKIIPDSIVFF
jgi:hypothetical protein